MRFSKSPPLKCCWEWDSPRRPLPPNASQAKPAKPRCVALCALSDLCIRAWDEVAPKRSIIRTFLLGVVAIAGAACVYEYGPLRCATSIDVEVDNR